MQRLEFTDSNLSNIKPVDVRKHYKDISSRLCLRVYPSGKKSFFVNTKAKEMVVIGEYPIVSIAEARIVAQEKYEMHTFASLLKKVKEYEKEVLHYSKEKIEKRWKVLAARCCMLAQILEINTSKEDLLEILSIHLKDIEEKRGKSAIIKTYRKLSELLKIACDAKIMAKQVNIKALSKHVPEPRKREIYIHGKEDMEAFLKACMDKEENEIFIVDFF